MDLPLRARAFLIHLAFSSAIAIAAIGVIFAVWHPGVLADLQGISQLILVLIGVDVTLGPLLTLVLFNPGKARHLLKLDLSIIAICQLAALLYGLTSIFLARPVFIVFNVDRFTIVTAGEIVEESLSRTQNSEFRKLPLGRPQIVASQLPESAEARSELLFYSLETGNDIYQMPEFYTPYDSALESVVKRANPLSSLQKSNALDNAQWQEFLTTLGQPPDSLSTLPVEGNARDGSAIVDTKTGRVVKITTLTPAWHTKKANP